jgi:hypothetical protein
VWRALTCSLVGKASSSKKVQRAAKAAASSRGTGEKRELGFPMLVVLIAVLGVALVWMARESRDELVAPFLDDHWHLGYEVYDCGQLQPALLNEFDPDGIHTHGDGLIHIHPFNSSATGADARLGVFMDAVGLTVTNDLIDADETGFSPIDGTSGCGGEESEIRVARYDAGNTESPLTEFDGDFRDIRFLENLETLIIAKVPVGGDMPTPSAEVQAQLVTHGAGTNEASETPFTLDPLSDVPDEETPAEDDAPEDDATDGEDAES